MADKAVIWDMDGVIVDTAAWHFVAWRQLCHRVGLELSEERFRASFGQRNEEIIKSLLGATVDGERIRALAADKEELFRAAVGDQARPLPGVIPLVSALKDAGYAQAIGSSAPRRNIDLLSGALGLGGLFDAIVSEADVTNGKPNPRIFLIAAQRLGVPPERCVVIEDAVAGLQAAKAAGMACLAVTNTRDRRALDGADLVVDSLEEVGLDAIARLLRLDGNDR